MANLGFIAFQDVKERQVLWLFFPMLAILFTLLHYIQLDSGLILLWEIATNWLLVTCVILVLYTYTKLIAKIPFLGHSMGLGDILFFYAFGTGFGTTVFVVLLATSILFSLLSFLVLKHKMQSQTVPLAGFMGLFLIAVLGFSEIFKATLLYGY